MDSTSASAIGFVKQLNAFAVEKDDLGIYKKHQDIVDHLFDCISHFSTFSFVFLAPCRPISPLAIFIVYFDLPKYQC